MTVHEWAARWKRNDDYPDCLSCGSSNTKEHHFTQVPGSTRRKLARFFTKDTCCCPTGLNDLRALPAQTWCRGKKKWESELLCMDCHSFTWRDYADPDFKTPEEYERERWEQLMKEHPVGTAIAL